VRSPASEYGDKHWFGAPKPEAHDWLWSEDTRSLGAEVPVDEWAFTYFFEDERPLQPYEIGARRRAYSTHDDDPDSVEDKLLVAVELWRRKKQHPEDPPLGRTNFLKDAKRKAYQRAYQARYKARKKRERAERRRQREELQLLLAQEPFIHTVIVQRGDVEECLTRAEYERRYGPLFR